jgi:hypothetical protein
MIWKQGLRVVAMALLVFISAAPVRASTEQASTDANKAAADCAKYGGWYDAAAGMCDLNGVK